MLASNSPRLDGRSVSRRVKTVGKQHEFVIVSLYFRKHVKEEAKILIRLVPIGFRRLNQAVKPRARVRTRRRVRKELVLSPYDKGPNRIFDRIIVRCQKRMTKIAYNVVPLPHGIGDRFPKPARGRHALTS